MKIAFLTTFYPPQWLGGTEIASKNLVDKLNEKNEVEVITCENKIPKFKLVSYFFSALRKLKNKDYDLIHCQSTFPGLIAYFSREKYQVYCRGSDIYLAKGWKKLMNKLVLKNAERIISLTKDMQKRIRNDYSLESEILPNGVNLEDYRGSKEKREGKIRKDFSILYIGTLKKIKGVNYLLEAFKKIEERDPFVQLRILGDGPEIKNLENLVKELKIKNINFLGAKKNKEIPAYTLISDLLVLPSLSEGFPNALLEGMASGLPIIATKVGGNSEIIREGGNGFLVEPKNSKALEKVILKIYKNKNLQREISKNNLKEVKKYSWEKIAKKLINS